jgi:hypothetical protein
MKRNHNPKGNYKIECRATRTSDKCEGRIRCRGGVSIPFWPVTPAVSPISNSSYFVAFIRSLIAFSENWSGIILMGEGHDFEIVTTIHPSNWNSSGSGFHYVTHLVGLEEWNPMQYKGLLVHESTCSLFCAHFGSCASENVQVWNLFIFVQIWKHSC